MVGAGVDRSPAPGQFGEMRPRREEKVKILALDYIQNHVYALTSHGKVMVKGLVICNHKVYKVCISVDLRQLVPGNFSMDNLPKR